MSYRKERDEFMRQTHAIGLDYDVTCKLLRYATTLHRLAEAQCNGDWPCDNGERKTVPCPLCEGGYVPSAITGGRLARAAWEQASTPTTGQQRIDTPKAKRKACPDCRTQAAVHLLLDGTQWQPYFQGDPHGAVLTLHPKGTSHDDMYCGRSRGVYVPTR